MSRLCSKTLAAACAAKPEFERESVGVGIVHLGIGAFHRAHQAVYTDSVLAARGGDWAIRGVSMRSAGVRDALKPQDYLYTLAKLGPDGHDLRVIGSVRDILVAPEDPTGVLRALCDPNVRVVSLTITEKGYCSDPAQGTLDFSHPDIVADLVNAEAPRSAIGLIVRALGARKANGGKPFTVMSCDNLPANGKTTRRLVLAMAEAVDGGLATWIGDHVSFPSTMVDRIVPATTTDLKALVARDLGLEDAWPVAAEPFSQWVIEDDFCAGRPAWESVGGELVSDAAPYELMKLRLVNGSHSALAYLGYLSGYSTIDAAMGDAGLVRFIQRMLDEEVTPTIQPPPAVEIEAYKAAALERYRNPALAHGTYQIAMDGSQKLPQRWLDSVRAQLAAGRSVKLLAVAVAGWIRYAMGVDEKGRSIDVKDPLAERFTVINRLAGREPAKLVSGYLALREIFGEELPVATPFVAEVTRALSGMLADGVAATVARVAR
ncbi:MAG: mannitol dehydrogenase family protein [Alphaproteobacteria bacterium]